MNFKKITIAVIVFLCLFSFSKTKSQNTKLLRNPDISNNHITFVYGGDIWLADKNGNNPKRLTTHPGVEIQPHFSPDGKLIAFSGQYDGNTDVYVISVDGGVPKRLTYHPARDNVKGWAPDGSVLFTTGRKNAPRTYNDQLYTIDIKGGMPKLFMKPRAHNGKFSPDGNFFAYRRCEPWEVEWRNYRGGQANPIRILNIKTFDLEKIPWKESNDISPVWIKDKVYFLSDRDYAMNIWSFNHSTKELKQETFYKEFDCKNLESNDEEMIYEYGGYLYTLKGGGATPQKINVKIESDFPWMRTHWEKVSNNINNFAVSPTGKRAVFEARGEIFTVPVKDGNVRNLTNSSNAADRSPAWSPDGKRISWFSDQSGDYQLFIADQYGKIIKKITFKKPTFYYSPQWSPDSKYVSFSDTDRILWMVNVETGVVTKIDDEGFSNPERIVNPEWSPDSKWIAYARRLQNEYSAVFVYSLDKKKSFQISDGMSECKSPVWDKNGKYLYLMASTNHALQTGWLDMSSYERPVRHSIYMVVLDKNEKNPLTAKSDDESEEKTDKDDKKSKDKKEEKVTVKIDFDGIQGRIISMGVTSRNYTQIESGNEGEIFYTEQIQNERGLTLHKYNLEKRKSEKLISGIRNFTISFDGKSILYNTSRSNWAISKTSDKPDAGKNKIKTGNLKMKLDPIAEYKQMFRESWRFQRDYFYVKNVHGLDMDWAYKTYSEWVNDVRHRSDMNYLLDIFSGETAVGHSFVGGGDFPDIERVNVGLLGADIEIENGAFRIKKIYTGESWNPDLRAPLSEPGMKVKEGDYILAVNGVTLNSGKNFYSYFENMANKQINIMVGNAPSISSAKKVTVVPVSSERNLREMEWVEENRRKVDELSNGQLAYVWIPNTGFGGYSNFNRYFFAQKDKKGAIIDERFNHGGSAADYIIDLLDRELMGYFNNPMGNKTSQTSPAAGLWGPKLMIVNESSGSGGDYMPYMFQKRKVGTLTGTRTWGGLVGIWDVPSLIDGGRITAPRGGFYDTDGKWAVENEGTSPDIEIEQDPKSIQNGNDPQLEESVKILLKQVKEQYKELKPAPEDPIRSVRPKK